MKRFILLASLFVGIVLCAASGSSVSADYTITAFAGTGTGGYSGDGGNATSAQFNAPCGVAIDSSGNVYIAEYGNHVIRKINTSGIISTFAGNGTEGFSGDGGSATSAQLDFVTGVAVDSSGNVYIADSVNLDPTSVHNVVRKVNTSGIISTFAGGGVSLGDGAAPLQLNLVCLME